MISDLDVLDSRMENEVCCEIQRVYIISVDSCCFLLVYFQFFYSVEKVMKPNCLLSHIDQDNILALDSRLSSDLLLATDSDDRFI